MAKQWLSISHLVEAFAQNQIILVPNNRLRNSLLNIYSREQKIKAWAVPRIYTLEQWIDICWAALQTQGHLPACKNILNKWQGLWWWESIIRNAPHTQHITNVKSLAQTADSSFKNLERWQLVTQFLQEFTGDLATNAAQFQGWISSFQQKLQLTNSITQEQRIDIIRSAFLDSTIPQEETIHLEGFDDIYPLAQDLLNSATAKIIKHPAQQIQNCIIRKTSANRFEEEIKAAAKWAREQLCEHKENSFIGIVVPNLGQSRDLVERIFVEEFESHYLNPFTPRYTLPFNFSAGVPLGKQPMLDTLQLLLSFNRQLIKVDDVIAVLQSPFWGDHQNEIVATYSIQKLQNLARREITLSELIVLVHHVESALSVAADFSLSKRLEQLTHSFRTKLSKKTPQHWLVTLDALIDTLGWPGARALDSIEYQQLQAFLRIREDIYCTSHVIPEIHYSDFLRMLRDMLDTTPFQAQTPQSPIQILGALEAAGLCFSHLWVMGLNDNQWPAVPSPTPLMPVEFQRSFNMPRASATREYEIAKQLTARYSQSAKEIVFSYSHTEGDNELRESALIRDLPETPIESLISNRTIAANSVDNFVNTLLSQHEFTHIDDSSGPVVSGTETVRGGSSLFKLQAACPFEAFVRLRLGAQSPDVPVLGLSPAERGNILHETLAVFFKNYPSSAAIQALTPVQIQDSLRIIATQVINRYQQKNPYQLSVRYCELETLRLVELLTQWISDEQLRPPFTVTAIEEAIETIFETIPLRLRVDRIDTLANGKQIVIDYKTGASTTRKSWQVERFSEPQLPLYAVIKPDISGVAFAVINRKTQHWDGYAAENAGNLGIDGITTHDDWDKQLNDWQERLTQLAQEFMSGHAAVVYQDKNALQYSEDLLPLNRLLDKTAVNRLVKGH